MAFKPRYDTGYDLAGQLTSAVKKTDSTNAVLKQYYYHYAAAGNRDSEQVDSNVTKTTPNNLNQISTIGGGGATRFQGTISKPGTVTVNGVPATMTSSTNCIANPVFSSGTTTVPVVAKDGSGNVQTNKYQVVIPPQATISPSYDFSGNMTSNGSGQTYTWDAENRLTKITQGSNTYQFAYDAFGRRISETNNGILAKQWVWVSAQLADERNASNTVTKRFYNQGEQIGGTPYFYSKDHLGSIREMTAGDGTIEARYDYDPYGRVTKLSGSMDSDFEYAGYYVHAPSGLNLTLFRAYDPNTGKWLSRDPLEELGGLNLYAYALNEPANKVDPYGNITLVELVVVGAILTVVTAVIVVAELNKTQREWEDKCKKILPLHHLQQIPVPRSYRNIRQMPPLSLSRMFKICSLL